MTSDILRTYVITLRQPWAWAVIHGGKDIENRSWKPAQPVRLLIHAGRTLDRRGVEQLHRRGFPVTGAELAGGQIIGMVDCLTWTQQRPRSHWADAKSRWYWQLTSPVPIKTPISMLGQPSFFHPPAGWERSFK
jgi:hypothetical protein